jgi:hypothetical protein
MAQQDLIKIHNVRTRDQQIAPHEDLVGMFQMVRDDRIITMINKKTGQAAEMIEILTIQPDELTEINIYGLHKENNAVEPYLLNAPTVDHLPNTPIQHPRDVGVGVNITETEFPAGQDPKNWSGQYHAELDRTVVRQTNNPAPQHNAVIVEHDLEGITPTTPINFPLEPTIRGYEISFYRVGSGNFEVLLDTVEKLYRFTQRNTRSDGTQDNHDFHIPLLESVKDIPSKTDDVTAIELDYDPDSQRPTFIKINEDVKHAINNAIQQILPTLEVDLTARRNERLRLRLNLIRYNEPDTTIETEVHLPNLIVEWGEVEGSIAEQADLVFALDKKANKIMDVETRTLEQAQIGDELRLVEFDTFTDFPTAPSDVETMKFANGYDLEVRPDGNVAYIKPPETVLLNAMYNGYHPLILDIDQSAIPVPPPAEERIDFEQGSLVATTGGQILRRNEYFNRLNLMAVGDYVGVVDFPSQLPHA